MAAALVARRYPDHIPADGALIIAYQAVGLVQLQIQSRE